MTNDIIVLDENELGNIAGGMGWNTFLAGAAAALALDLCEAAAYQAFIVGVALSAYIYLAENAGQQTRISCGFGASYPGMSNLY